MPVLKDILPEHINIIDSGEAVARQTKAVLEQHQLLSDFDGDPEHIFYTNADVEVLKDLVDRPTAQVAYLDF